MRKITDNKFFVALPIVLGILSWIIFIIFCYKINHTPYDHYEIIFAGLLLAFAGIIISVITKKSRKTYSGLWKAGLIICIPSFVICLFLGVFFVLMSMSLTFGEWKD